MFVVQEILVIFNILERRNFFYVPPRSGVVSDSSSNTCINHVYVAYLLTYSIKYLLTYYLLTFLLTYLVTYLLTYLLTYSM